MKLTLKIVGILLIIIMIILSDLILVKNSVQADSINQVNVYDKVYCDKVLIYSGKPLGGTYVVYNKDGIEYPAYCINPDLPGIGEVDQYDVTISGKIQDVKLWRILINGYPYKTIEELGVANEKEAYLATKQAVYYYLKNRDYNKYSADCDEGYRVLNAFRQIVETAENSTEIPSSNQSEITTNQTNWEQDLENKDYVSKTYEVKSSAIMKNYIITISGENIPEGIKITNISNKERNKFNKNEQFKILIPINNLNNNGEFKINVETESLTKPILYGVSQNQGFQNYALTVYEYEEGNTTYPENYGENKTKINILKQDKESKKPLQGIEFELLNENKEIIYSNLITDINGKIIIDKILPGKYYLKETRTLDGYINYDELIEINIELNETINIVVNNSKEKKIEVSNKITEIEVEQEKIIKKLPITGM